MSRIRSKDTKPELAVRRAVASLGHKYRLHVKGLPGAPDMANKRQKWAIFVHGCFWHSHKGCKFSSNPKSNRLYWIPKLERTQLRDHDNRRKLDDEDFSTLVIWECETADSTKLKRLIVDFFDTVQKVEKTRF
jgi:DNA mismatch endonuclease (patch repair protein)